MKNKLEVNERTLRGPVWLMQPIPYFGESLEGGWVVEPKIDGWRLQIVKHLSGKVKLWGRRLEKNPDWTDKLKQVTRLAGEILPSGTLIDAELYSTGGRRYIPSLFAKNPKASPVIYLFDVIFYQGKFVGDLPLEERKKILLKMTLKPPFYHVEFTPLVDLNRQLIEMVKRGHEGVVIKKLSSTYQLARDGPLATPDWRKIKPGR